MRLVSPYHDPPRLYGSSVWICLPFQHEAMFASLVSESTGVAFLYGPEDTGRTHGRASRRSCHDPHINSFPGGHNSLLTELGQSRHHRIIHTQT